MALVGINDKQATAFKAIQIFKPVRQPFDRYVLQSGPRLVVTQILITTAALGVIALYDYVLPKHQIITWSVDSPIYGAIMLALFAEAFAIRTFLHNIPKTFQRLLERAAIGNLQSDGKVAQRLCRFIEKFDRDINSSQRLLVGLPFAAVGLLFFWSTSHLAYTLRQISSQLDSLTKAIIIFVNLTTLFIPGVIVGYTIGISIWKCTVTGFYVREFSKIFELRVQPNHPDKAGGLKPLGDLMFAMAAILIVASLALSGLIIYASYIGFYYTHIYARIFLGITVLLSVIAFFVPLLSTHQRMISEKEELNPVLLEITQRIAELENNLHTQVYQMEHKTRKDTIEEINSLADLYNRTLATPSWPFDRDILFRFFTPQVFSLLSLFGVAEPIISAISSLFSRT